MSLFKVLTNFASMCSKKLTFGRAKPSKTGRKIINKLNREAEAESRRPIKKGRNRTESTCWTILLTFAFFMAALLISIAIDGRLKKKDRNCLDCQKLESFGLEEITDLAFSHHFFPEKDNKIVERYDLLIAYKEELGQLILWEQGKLLKEAISEVSYWASFTEFFAGEAKSVYDDIIPATLR